MTQAGSHRPVVHLAGVVHSHEANLRYFRRKWKERKKKEKKKKHYLKATDFQSKERSQSAFLP